MTLSVHGEGQGAGVHDLDESMHAVADVHLAEDVSSCAVVVGFHGESFLTVAVENISNISAIQTDFTEIGPFVHDFQIGGEVTTFGILFYHYGEIEGPTSIRDLSGFL